MTLKNLVTRFFKVGEILKKNYGGRAGGGMREGSWLLHVVMSRWGGRPESPCQGGFGQGAPREEDLDKVPVHVKKVLDQGPCP